MVYNGGVHLCGPLEPGRFESMSKLAAAGQYRMQPASMHRRYAPSCAWSIRAKTHGSWRQHVCIWHLARRLMRQPNSHALLPIVSLKQKLMTRQIVTPPLPLAVSPAGGGFSIWRQA
jgi:hypothetical protein